MFGMRRRVWRPSMSQTRRNGRVAGHPPPISRSWDGWWPATRRHSPAWSSNTTADSSGSHGSSSTTTRLPRKSCRTPGLAVLNGLRAFEGRSALRTWIFAIVSNRAKSRGVRERRSIPFSNLSDDKDDDQPVVEPERFTSGGAWSLPPRRRHNDTPETLLLQRETLALVERTVAALPPKQRAVVTLRTEGLEAAVVCNILGLSGTNQRVLLHRGRSTVREALEGHLMKRPRDVRPRRSEHPLACHAISFPQRVGIIPDGRRVGSHPS